MDTITPLLADVFTIAASAIAIYLFIAKRKVIAQTFRLLLGFSFQMTLTELKGKLERLNELSADDPSEVDEVVNILNDIVGQIRGHRLLRKECQREELLTRIAAIAENKRRLTEPRKRSLVSELRERIRNVSLQDYADFMGDQE